MVSGMVVYGKDFPMGIGLCPYAIQTFRKKMCGILKGYNNAYLGILHTAKKLNSRGKCTASIKRKQIWRNIIRFCLFMGQHFRGVMLLKQFFESSFQNSLNVFSTIRVSH